MKSAQIEPGSSQWANRAVVRWGMGPIGLGLLALNLGGAAQAQGLPNSGLTSLTTTPTAVQLAALQATGIKVVLPGYVPPGFQLDTVSVQANRSPKSGGYRTLIVYQKTEPVTTTSTALTAALAAPPQCFAIEAVTATAQPLPPGTTSFPVNSPVFGRSQLNYGLYRTVAMAVPMAVVAQPISSTAAPIPIAQPIPASAATWLSDWLGVPTVIGGVVTPATPVYRFIGAGTDARLANCDNVPTAEAVKIIESLQFYTVPTTASTGAAVVAPVTAAPAKTSSLSQ
jgi:hypothetical protein